MKKDEKKSKKRSFDMESADAAIPQGLGTVSASEATGMMYCPPRSEDELRSREQLFSLQVNMPPEGHVGSEREWRSDIERFFEDEAKTPLKDTPINYMARQDVLDPANTFAPIDEP